MMIRNFRDIETSLSGKEETLTIAVVMATDASTRGAVARALAAGIARAVFVGARREVEADSDLMRHGDRLTITDAGDIDQACAAAVALAREGKANVVMKGMVNTDNLLRAILNKETGILHPGDVLTHITVAQTEAYHKLLAFTDAAVIPYPTPAQRDAQLRYVLRLVRKLGAETPRVALVHCSEKADERHFPFTADYLDIKARAAGGAYGSCIVDGPLDVKTSCSKAALQKKGIESPLEGDSDALIFPDIEAGNTFYKTLTMFAGARVGGMLCGSSVPVVLGSRGDDTDSKYDSLTLAMHFSI